MSQAKQPINFDGLTLDNFAERTTQRFRMTKNQKGRNLSREAAFQEWLVAAKAAANTVPVAEAVPASTPDTPTASA